MTPRQTIYRSIFAAFLLLCSTGLSGCSLIGFGTGALIDGGKQDTENLNTGEAMKLDKGDELRIVLVDSTTVKGTYNGVTLCDSETYAKQYTDFLKSRHADDTPFPALGDTLLLDTKTSESSNRLLFRGFRPGLVRLQYTGSPFYTNIPFSQFTALENRDSVKLEAGMLERMDNAGQLPNDVSLVVQTNGDTMRVPLNDIDHCEKAVSKNARWIGLGVGLAADVAAVVAISNIKFFGKGLFSGTP